MCRYILITISIFITCLCISKTVVVADQDEDIPHNEVRNWALKFGVDLWEFGRQFTRSNDIRNKYKDKEHDIIRKDGLILLRELAAEVKNFMDFKMNAVLRIMDLAEQALSESDHDSQQTQGQLSNSFYDARHINDYSTTDGRLVDGSKEMQLKKMRRFEDLSVNLSHSTIFIPAGIDINDPDIQSAIAWSSHLDPLFANNLERDSALSWQYFGSSTGFLRRFPGTIWPQENSKENKPIYDFRTNDWFVQAASSPKDIVILLDASGSMAGKTFDLGIATASIILDSLGDNDFINLIIFSDVTKSVVPCFKDKLVRATPDNVKEIKAAMKGVKCENVANFTAGFVYAFELLQRYNKSGHGSQCNQAIMLITDGTSETHTEIIKHYNWPHMPVRIFTYLLGGDSSSRENMHKIACTNKGYFVAINTYDEIPSKVYPFALVMGRPMVMYQADHPIHWSPVFVAGYSANLGRDNDKRRRLVTTISTPVFDKRNHSVRVANLLGVVGTDVPIDEIKKVIPQHKLGANGYLFIVDNNGKIVYHPDLRPLSDGEQYIDTLKPRYNSVDLSEIELIDLEANNVKDGEETSLTDMRNEMVDRSEGEIEFPVYAHYDNMKRVSLRMQKYFYGPIEGTPFALAFALPQKYGMHELNSQEEIKHLNTNATRFFKGKNWRVHPDWVYCEYNSLHDLGKEKENSGESFGAEQQTIFDTPEEQLLHFLDRTSQPRWKWMSLRPRSAPQHGHGHGAIPVGHHAQHFNNIRQSASKKTEPYYCDRALVQSLVRDAIATDELDGPLTPARGEDKQQGYQMFGVKISFVATRSGLLRWIDHIPHPEDSNELHFGETNARAMDMSWYKRAIEQHSIEPDSFVFSVPFNSGYTTKANAPLVTAAHAIFIEYRGHKAPAAVVGLQFQHDSLARHFRNITSACSSTSGGSCRKICGSEDLDCYILDNNGFVILSNDTEHTGRFFGQIDGTIMDSLVQDRIYKRITVTDYQGVCSDSNNLYTAASENVKVMKIFSLFTKYLTSMFTTWITMLPKYVTSMEGFRNPNLNIDNDDDDDDDDDDDYNDYESEMDEYTTAKSEIPPIPLKQTVPSQRRIITDPQHSRQCDLNTDLYVLQPDRLNSSTPLKGKLTNCHVSGCERPFSVQKIPHSNLILLVVDTMCPCGSKQLDIEPEEIPDGIGACSKRKINKEFLSHKRPTKCINYHPEETEIHQCGRATTLFSSSLIPHFCMFIVMWIILHQTS